MPTTITSYTTFTAATKAKSSEVNTNFSNHRGTLLPINDDTATASDGTHDLGSDEHRWNDAYVNSIDFETSTNTASLTLQGQVGNTTGGLELLVEGVTAAAFGATGMERTTIAPSTSFIAITGETGTASTSGTIHVASTNFTCFGGPIMIGMSSGKTANTNSGIAVGSADTAVVNFLVDSLTIASQKIEGPTNNGGTWPSSSFSHLSVDITAGASRLFAVQCRSVIGVVQAESIVFHVYEIK